MEQPVVRQETGDWQDSKASESSEIGYKWSSLSTLLQLFECLPESILDISFDDGQYPANVSFKDDYTPQEKDFLHCRDIAQYIQCLGYDLDLSESVTRIRDTWKLDSKVYDALKSYRVLPLQNLQSYNVMTTAEYGSLHHIVGPKTTSITLNFMSARVCQLKSNIRELVTLPPGLRILRIRDVDIRLRKYISASLSHFFKHTPNNGLETLQLSSCTVLNKTAFSLALSSATLRQLEIGRIASDYIKLIPFSSTQRLHHLQVAFQGWFDVFAFLIHIGPNGLSELRSLKLEIYVPRDPIIPEMFLPQILYESFSRMKTLALWKCKELVKVEFDYFFEQNAVRLHLNDQDHSIIRDTIGELYKLPNLREVNLRCQMSDDVTRAEFEHSSQSVGLSFMVWNPFPKGRGLWQPKERLLWKKVKYRSVERWVLCADFDFDDSRSGTFVIDTEY